MPLWYHSPLMKAARREPVDRVPIWEVPGVQMSNIEINVVGNELSIKGKRECGCGEGVTIHRQERGSGEFSRFLTLPVAIDAEKVEAVLKNGVLTIKLPKAEAAKPRRIEVKTN